MFVQPLSVLIMTISNDTHPIAHNHNTKWLQGVVEALAQVNGDKQG